MMMMGGMGGSGGAGGSMGMDPMMNMGGAGSMNMTGSMQGMAGMDPSAMNGMINQMPGWPGMQGMAGISQNNLPGMGGGLDFTSLLGGLLNITISIFVVLLFVGLIAGAVVFVKRYLFDGMLLPVSSQAVCRKCGQSLRADWSACPKCGEAKVIMVNAAPQTV